MVKIVFFMISTSYYEIKKDWITLSSLVNSCGKDTVRVELTTILIVAGMSIAHLCAYVDGLTTYRQGIRGQGLFGCRCFFVFSHFGHNTAFFCIVFYLFANFFNISVLLVFIRCPIFIHNFSCG